MLTLEKFKRLLAMLILMCFFIPLSQCTVKAPVSKHTIPETSSTTEVFIPVAAVQFKEIDEVVIIALFAWPLVVLAFRRRVHTVAKEILVNSIELIFSATSFSYLVWVFHLWDEVRCGGIIALTTYSAYFLTSSFILCRYAIRKFV